MYRRMILVALIFGLVACNWGSSSKTPNGENNATQAARLVSQPVGAAGAPETLAVPGLAPVGGDATPTGGVSSGSGRAPTAGSGTAPAGSGYTPAAGPRLHPSTGTPLPATEIPATATPTPPPFALCSPLAGVVREDLPHLISDEYTAPPSNSDARHEGVDFVYYRWKDLGPIGGSPLQAMMAGRVVAALEGTFPYGSFIIIETPNAWMPAALKEALNLPEDASLYHLYAHLQEGSLQVALDDPVTACQVVGAVGKTGNTAAAHLHLETRSGPAGARFTMMSAFTDTATVEEKRSYRLWRVSRTYLHFDPMRLLGFGMLNWPTPVPPGLKPVEK